MKEIIDGVRKEIPIEKMREIMSDLNKQLDEMEKKQKDTKK